jgi:hypothetical protein
MLIIKALVSLLSKSVGDSLVSHPSKSLRQTKQKFPANDCDYPQGTLTLYAAIITYCLYS